MIVEKARRNGRLRQLERSSAGNKRRVEGKPGKHMVGQKNLSPGTAGAVTVLDFEECPPGFEYQVKREKTET